MTYLIIARTPGGSVWTYSEHEGFGVARYKSREVAERICARLNGLGLEWSYKVICREDAA